MTDPANPSINGWPTATVLIYPSEGDLLVIDTRYAQQRGGFILPTALATFTNEKGSFRLEGEPLTREDDEQQRRANGTLNVLLGTSGCIRPGGNGDGAFLGIAGRERDGYALRVLAQESLRDGTDALGRRVWLLGMLP